MRTGVRAVEGTGLENRRAGNGTVGSNPTLSVRELMRWIRAPHRRGGGARCVKRQVADQAAPGVWRGVVNPRISCSPKTGRRKAFRSNAHAVRQQRAGAPRADPRHRFSIALGARDAYEHLLPPQVTACVVVLDPPAPVAVRVIV